jgi:hypothetical protein
VDQQRQPRWWQRRQLLWAVGIIVAIALMISLFGGYSFGWKWTGFVNTCLVAFSPRNYPRDSLIVGLLAWFQSAFLVEGLLQSDPSSMKLLLPLCWPQPAVLEAQLE